MVKVESGKITEGMVVTYVGGRSSIDGGSEQFDETSITGIPRKLPAINIGATRWVKLGEESL